MNKLNEEIEQFLLDRKAANLTAGSLLFYRKKLAVFAAFCDQNRVGSVSEITPTLLRKFILWLEETNHSAGGVATFYRTVRAFINWAENEFDLVWKNPMRKVRAPKVPNLPLEPVTPQQVEALLATCDRSTFTGNRDYTIILVLLDSGLRASELIALDLPDFDPNDNGLLVQSGKGRKTRTTFVGETTSAAIQDWLRVRGDQPGALFEKKTGGRMTYGGLREVFRRRSRIANIPQPGIHDFRRAFCLSLLSAGVDLVSLSRLMGHASIQLIQTYAKQNRSHLREAYRSPVEGE